MKLYYAPGTCALAPIILAEWLALPLEIEKVNHKDPDEEYLAKNPLGAVPALELDNGQVRNQVDAILQYFLALKPGSGLGPGEDPDDGFEFHRWNAFLTGDFHPPFGAWFNPKRFTTDHSEASLAAVKQAVGERIARVTRVLEAQVDEQGHIALGRRTMLDAYAFAMVRWIRNLDSGFDPYPKLGNFIAKMKQDEGVQRALAREKS